MKEFLQTLYTAIVYIGFAGLIGIGFTIGCGIGRKILDILGLESR